VCRHIEKSREDDSRKQLIIVLIESSDKDPEALKSAGADFVFSSPFSLEQLQFAIESHEQAEALTPIEMASTSHSPVTPTAVATVQRTEDRASDRYSSMGSYPSELLSPDNSLPNSPLLSLRHEAVGNLSGSLSLPRKSLEAMQILIVDDSIPILKALKKTLTNAKYEVTTAENGSIALDLLMKSYYDAVVCDQQMPVMDGPEAIRRLRAFEAETGRKHQLVIGMSANSDEDCKLLALESGVDFFTQKPFGLRRLQEILKEYYAIGSFDLGTTPDHT
jgi:CheY-like chemotaxis protein